MKPAIERSKEGIHEGGHAQTQSLHLVARTTMAAEVGCKVFCVHLGPLLVRTRGGLWV